METPRPGWILRRRRGGGHTRAVAAVQEPVQGTATDSARTEAVRQAAARLFEAAGYAGTTMTEIAQAVGVLPGSLYHHFPSKEQIAVDLLTTFGKALADVGRAAAAAPPTEGAAAEVRVRQLAAEVMTLSFQHAAAIRLRAFEPPSVATARLHAALQLETSALNRAWRDAVGALKPTRADGGADLALLGFTLQHAVLDATANYPTDLAAPSLAEHLCDALLHGLAPDAPSDHDLDSSAASRAALEAVGAWRVVDDRGSTRSDRDVIVAAARTEFARRGYNATTIRDIATAAKVRMGTLYRRVESKEALLREILGNYSGQLGSAFQAAVGAGSSAVEALDALARVFVQASRRFEAESCIVRYGWSGREASTSPFHDYYLETQERRHLLEQLIRGGTAGGALRSVTEPAEMALHVRSILWVPFHKHTRTSTARSHAFLRATLLRGALTG